MSRILPATLRRQQSFSPTWVSGDTGDIPTGVIIDLQVTTESSSPVLLSALSIDNGRLAIAISQDNAICAYGDLLREHSISALQVNSPIMSASIEIGSLTGLSYNSTFDKAVISQSNVAVINTSDVIPDKIIIQQGDDVFEQNIDSDINVTVDPKLTAEYDEYTGRLTISMSDDIYKELVRNQNEIISETRLFNGINGVTTTSGKISLRIYHNGRILPVTARASNWVELDGVGINLCPTYTDSLDSVLSPNTHSGYLPLDDMYDKNKKRNTKASENWEYGGLGGFGGGKKVKLYDIDPNIDSKLEGDDQ